FSMPPAAAGQRPAGAAINGLPAGDRRPNDSRSGGSLSRGYHLHNRAVLPIKRRVKRHVARREVELPQELARLAGAMLAFHAAVFPLNRQRAIVLDDVERPDDLFEVHAAATGRAEVPTATRI